MQLDGCCERRLLGRLNGLGLKVPEVWDLSIATMLKVQAEVRGMRVEVRRARRHEAGEEIGWTVGHR